MVTQLKKLLGFRYEKDLDFVTNGWAASLLVEFTPSAVKKVRTSDCIPCPEVIKGVSPRFQTNVRSDSIFKDRGR